MTIAWYRLALYLLLIVGARHTIAQDSEQTCLADGTHCTCRDDHEHCAYWQTQGECEKNASWMEMNCPASCRICDPNEIDLGLVQNTDEDHRAQVDEIMKKAKEYVQKVSSDEFLQPALPGCKNKHQSCALWASMGECANNPAYMRKNCAPVCESCDQLTVETRCTLDPNATNALLPGTLNEIFINITTLAENQKYNPVILARPKVDGNAPVEATTTIEGPWVVLLENFITDEECARLIELGAAVGYARSAGLGTQKLDGTFENNVIDGRTSMNAWCQGKCFNDTMAKSVMYRIANLTGIPDENSEYLQLLQYKVGQFYHAHHDYIDYHLNRQQGVRLLTVFLYLNDVDAGGGTNFPELNITVMPKRGRALIWPSVKDESPDEKDDRTTHQALKVEAGIKYGANAWIHQRDFKKAYLTECQ